MLAAHHSRAAPAGTARRPSSGAASAAAADARLETYPAAGGDLSLASLALGGIPLSARGESAAHTAPSSQHAPLPPRASPPAASGRLPGSPARLHSPGSRARPRSPEPLPAHVGSAVPVVLRGKGRRRSVDHSVAELKPITVPDDDEVLSPSDLLSIPTGALVFSPSPRDAGDDSRLHARTIKEVDALVCPRSPQKDGIEGQDAPDSPLFNPLQPEVVPESAIPRTESPLIQPLPFALDVVRVGQERAAVDVLRAIVDSENKVESQHESTSASEAPNSGPVPSSSSLNLSTTRRGIFSGLRSPVHSPEVGFSSRAPTASVPASELDAESAAAVAIVDAELDHMLASVLAAEEDHHDM